MKRNNLLKLIIAIGVSLLPGAIGSFFTVSAIPGWYVELIKPAVNPPSWVFGPAWTTLYVLMGVAAYLVWTRESVGLRQRKRALIIFDIQLVLNALWSIIFFGLERPGAAFIEIIVLWCSLLLTILIFSKISRLATALLVPYIVWVSFAVYLNYAIWMLN